MNANVELSNARDYCNFFTELAINLEKSLECLETVMDYLDDHNKAYLDVHREKSERFANISFDYLYETISLLKNASRAAGQTIPGHTGGCECTQEVNA